MTDTRARGGAPSVLRQEVAEGVALIQSPFLHLQAAGSDGSDGSVRGIHLGWNLLRRLNEHLPKGNLAAGPAPSYPASGGFNRPDDFVYLLRAPYNRRLPYTVNFANSRPAAVDETGTRRIWRFEAPEGPTNAKKGQEVVIRFDDIAQYDAIRASIDPATAPSAFLARYSGVMEAEVPGELAFCLSVIVAPLRSGGSGGGSGVSPVSALRAPLISGAYGFRRRLERLGLSYRRDAIDDSVHRDEPDPDPIRGEPPRREAVLRVEAVSVEENLPDAELSISCRRRFFPTMPICICSPDAVYRTCAENVRYFRFDYAGCMPVELQLETYQRFIATSLEEDRPAWTPLGDGFSLTDQDAIAFDRLEHAATGPVDGRWPRYLGADPVTGLFTASVSNYRNKWDPTLPPLAEATDANGLKRAVMEYLTLSATASNPTAAAALPADDASDAAAFNISYLAMLKLIALDFHAARMLGLGHIDAGTAADAATQFVYLAIYRTSAAVEPGGTAGPRTHLSMTLPTAQREQRLPRPPVQEPPSFGISVDTGGGAIALTDPNGYSLFDPSRIVNLHLAPNDTVAPFGPFFTPPVEFCSSETTRGVFYGCKYRLVGEADDRRPELSHDLEFADGAGVAETAPLLPQAAAFAGGPVPPIFSHEQTEEGLQRYGFYAVNRFARPSVLGNTQDVDTHFPVRHHLLPPTNLAVQLIQPEDPPILTTADEQQRLANLPAGDSTLVRCTFDWNQAHYIAQRFSAANVYPDLAQLFFRPDPPRIVQGEIKSVIALPGDRAEIRTLPYVLTSVVPTQSVSPVVAAGDAPRFAGGYLAADQLLYRVDSVAPSTVAGEGAVFQVRAQVQVSAVDLDNNNQQSAATQTELPAVGQRFTVVENMNEPLNWAPGDPLAKTVALRTFLDGGQLHRETVSNPDGSQTTYNIGGVVDTAQIDEALDVDPNSPPSPPEGTPVPGSRTGVYRIQFDNFQLAAHPDPDVEWGLGTVRIPVSAGGPRKVLDVWSINTSGPTLVLTAHDPAFDADPYPSYALRPGYTPIPTGAAVPVNFHPGYRVYLTAQAGVMDGATILPGQSQSGRQSFMAVRSRNSALAIESGLTPPVMLQAHRISPPMQPGRPSGPLYATRPDPVYGKASWTMDIKVVADSNRQPYAMVFYRANEQSLLDLLYKPDTVEAIRTALAALAPADATFDQDRWSDLVNLGPLHADNGFKDYVPGGYRFPIPDNPSYVIPGTTLTPFDGQIRPGDPNPTFAVGDEIVTMLQVLKGAVASIFLPLTETPVLYEWLKSGGQTSARKPVTRDGGGAPLDPSDPAFDPAPMAVRHASGGDSFVRFTDYTLDGAASNIYFYYGVELNDEMKFGPPGAIAGPVRLVNAYPAQPPAIRNVTSVVADAAMQRTTAVRLLLNAYIASEGITRFNLYRATDPADAASVRTMTLVGGFDAVAGLETELVDEFADLAFPPFGDPLSYRVTALRRIVNERTTVELIPSHASEAVRTSVVDIDSPRAPRPGFTSDPPTLSPPFLLHNVTLSWRPVTHNATYRLFKLGPTGVWNPIYEIKSNSDPISVALANTTLGTDALAKQDVDGNPIRHQFRLEVENASGSFSLNEAVLSVPATREDGYTMLGAILSYADQYQAPTPLADLLCDPAITTFPGTMTFQDITGALPAGHVFDRIEVSLADGLAHGARNTIAAPGGAVTFQHGDGTGIVLDGSSINATYAVRARLFTDACPDGFLFVFSLRFGPELALLGLSAVVDYADSQNVSAPLDNAFAAGGLSFPTTMTFTDVAVLPAGHSFVQSLITVSDDLGASFSRSIATQGGSVTFVQGDGGLSLDGAQPGRVYQATVRLFTDLSPGGIAFNYVLAYG